MPRHCRSYKRVRASTSKLVWRCARYKKAKSRLRRHASTPGCTRFKRVYSSAYGKKVWRCAKRRSVTSHRVTTYVTPQSVMPLLAPAVQQPAWVSISMMPAKPTTVVLPDEVEVLPPAISPQVARRLRDQMRRLRPSSMPFSTSRWPQNRPKVRP